MQLHYSAISKYDSKSVFIYRNIHWIRWKEIYNQYRNKLLHTKLIKSIKFYPNVLHLHLQICVTSWYHPYSSCKSRLSLYGDIGYHLQWSSRKTEISHKICLKLICKLTLIYCQGLYYNYISFIGHLFSPRLWSLTKVIFTAQNWPHTKTTFWYY